jgi:hypothetical protein
MRTYSVARHFLCVVSLVVLSNCASVDLSSTVPVVPVEAVINKLKCGFARVLDADERRRSGLFGGVAKIELDVNVVQGVDASGKISVGIPIFSGAGTITPSLGFGHTETRTINSSIDFDIALRSHGTAVCGSAYAASDADSGFSIWIGSVVAGINRVVAGPPTAQMKKYVYESDFTVKASSSFGLDVEIVPVKLSTSVGSSRSDIQHMKITIDAVRLVKDEHGQVKVVPGGPRFAPGVRPPPSPDGHERRGSFNLPAK